MHLAAAMNQKHLLRFIKRKVRYHPDEVVTKNSKGQDMTLSQVFDEMGLTPYDLSIDALGMHTDASTFARFDKFNLKYNPLGKSKLREIFIKTDNAIDGRYFAEITQVHAQHLLTPSDAFAHLPSPSIAFAGAL